MQINSGKRAPASAEIGKASAQSNSVAAFDPPQPVLSSPAAARATPQPPVGRGATGGQPSFDPLEWSAIFGVALSVAIMAYFTAQVIRWALS